MKKLVKGTSIMLSAALAAGCALPAFAASEVKRDETAFLTLNPDGSVKTQTVSVWLHDDGGLSDYEDTVNIQNPINLKGSWELEQQGDRLRFHGEGNDVYYQGETQMTPPIIASIQYQLDGNPITAQELLGKSGHVTIRISLQNTQKYEKKIGGSLRTLYTPFAAAVAVNLPTGDFRNVTAEHGMVQTDSLNQIAAFVTLPGMRQSLDGLLPRQAEDLYDFFLDEVVVEADTDSFQMPDIMLTAATSLEELEEKLPMETDEMKDLQKDLDKLKDATNDLKEGISKLQEATGTMKEGAQTLDGAVDTLNSGANELNGGAKSLSEGAASLADGTAKVADGAANLNSLLGEVCKNNDTLNGGAGQLFAAVVSGANVQLNAALAQQGMEPVSFGTENYTEVVNGLLAALGEENIAAQVREGVKQQVYTEENKTMATQGVTANLVARILVKAQAAAMGAELTEEEIAAKADAMLATDEGKAAVQQAIASNPLVQQALAENQQLIAELVEKQLAGIVEQQMAEGGAGWTILQEKLAAASSAGKQMNEMVAQLDQAKAFVEGVASYTGAVSRLYAEGSQPLASGAQAARDGASKLKEGAATLSGGTASLVDGASKLKAGTKQMVDGAVQLAGGAGELSSGMNEYAEEGIGKMTDSIEEMGLDTLKEVADEIQALADGYTGYTGTDEEVKSSVKFVMKTEAPEAPEEQEETTSAAAEKETVSFWQRVKNLFH